MRRPGGPPPDARLGRGSRPDAERVAGRARATASVEAQLAAASITPEPRDEELRVRRRSSASTIDATAIDAMVQPLVDEVERLQVRTGSAAGAHPFAMRLSGRPSQLRIRALEREVSEERQRGRATEKRMLAHVQALLSKRTNAVDDAAGAFALPPAGHPFWRQPEAPATAIRMLADAEAARARCAAQLEAADELQRTRAAQVDTLQAKNRALTSAAMSMEMAGTARRA
jgi:hypothetical protein